MSNKDIINEFDEYVLGSYGRYPIALKFGKGATCFDEDNNKYIDFGSAIGVNVLGYSNEAWIRAICEQANDISNISNYYYNKQVMSLAKSLCQSADMAKVFFANSGTEANEGAIKLARKYSYDKYGKNRYHVVSLKSSFHGRTMGALSATGQQALHESFTPMLDGFDFIDANDISQVDNINKDKTCAIILEIIQGEGGVLPLSESYIKHVYQYCQANDILLIIDEVQTGIGRTGKLFAFQHFDIQPDIITLSKGLGGGLPIGCFIVTKDLQHVLKPGNHGSTFGGNPIVCSGANAVLNIVNNEDFLNDVSEKGDYIKASLSNVNSVQRIFAKGLMIGITLANEINAHDIAKKCYENGLLVLTAKNNLRLLPPLTITKDELDMGIGILLKVLRNEG